MIEKFNLKNLALLVLVIGSGMLCGQAYFNAFLPGSEPVPARSLGMGATGAATEIGYGNLWSNPALLSGADGLGIITVNSGILRRVEQRSFAVYDYFDDVAVTNIYVTNRNWYDDISGGLTVNLPFNTVLGLARSTFWDWRYDYQEQVRGELSAGNYNRDPLVGYHKIERQGSINATSAGIGFRPLAGLQVGLAGHFLSANDLSQVAGVIVIEEDEALAATDTFLISSDFELEGLPMILTTGVSYRVLPALQLGFSYRSGVKLGIDGFELTPTIVERTLLPGYEARDTVTAVDFSLPAVVSFGLEARLNNPIATKAVVEASRTSWSDYAAEFAVSDDSTATLEHDFQDTWEVKVGVEHVLLGELPFRFGLVFAQSPLGQEFETTRVTVGGSYQLGSAILDIGASIGMVEYQYEDLFPAVSQDAETLELETVNETATRVNISLSVPF